MCAVTWGGRPLPAERERAGPGLRLREVRGAGAGTLRGTLRQPVLGVEGKLVWSSFLTEKLWSEELSPRDGSGS